MRDVTRRGFIGGGLATGALAAMGAVAACSPQSKSSGESQANGDGATGYTWETKPDDIPESDITEVKEADVIVVGGGPSGFVTAASCAENGLSVILIEKDDSFNANGGAIFACNSSYQKSIGYEVDKDAICQQYLEINGKKVDQKIVWRMFDRSGEAIDWLAAILDQYGLYPVMQGIGFADDPDNSAIPGTVVFYGGPNTPTDVTDYDPYTCDLGLGFVPMVDYLESLSDYIAPMGVVVEYGVSSERIIRQGDGRVEGIIAYRTDGKYIRYNAHKAVVIASGDYGADPEMMGYFCPQAARFGASLPVVSPNTGDLHRQAMWIGAAMQKWPDHAPSGFCGEAHPIWNLNVNTRGVRFTNEDTSTTSLSWAILQQPEGVTYSIFDAAYATTLPYVPGYIGAEVPTPEQMLARWDKYVEEGVYSKADTIEELAETLGLDAAILAKTVADYNALCAAGEDTEYHKRADLLFPLSAPFYGFRSGVTMLTAHGGLHVDPSCRVLTAEDAPIEGLYAVGLAAGDYWANSYTTRYAGSSHGHNVTTGYLVGREIAGLE
ncbi:MAG: FAD-binding protein [Bifidobacteriaceae bacterium]|nr:FAD-binding protein [Bifidobacteriaceae bacterium]